MILAHILFWVMVAGVFISIVLYPAIIRMMARRRNHLTSPLIEPITIIVPARNEERYLRRKIDNLMESDYPPDQMEIIIVESGSDDHTAEIARDLPASLLRSEAGKVNAINEGLRNASSDIIVVTDADTLLENTSIRNLVAHLEGKVGAVSGYSHLREPKHHRLFYFNSKLKYDRSEWRLRYAEGLVNSTRNLDGKLMAFRKSIIPELPAKFLCDDFPLTLSVIRKGYRCVVAADAPVYEETPASLKEEIKQIRRRTAIGITSGLHFVPGMLFNPRYSIFGMLTAPFRILITMFFPFMVVYMMLYLLILAPITGATIIGGILVTVLLLRGSYAFIQFYGMCLAWADIITGRTRGLTTWEQIRNDS